MDKTIGHLDGLFVLVHLVHFCYFRHYRLPLAHEFSLLYTPMFTQRAILVDFQDAVPSPQTASSCYTCHNICLGFMAELMSTL